MAKDLIKDLRKKEKLEKEALLKAACEKRAIDTIGKEKLDALQKEHKGLWFLPAQDEDGNIVKMAIFKPISRQTMAFAFEKMQSEGLMEFLYTGMESCFVEGDREILDDDQYFIPASQQFNKVMDGYNTSLVKR